MRSGLGCSSSLDGAVFFGVAAVEFLQLDDSLVLDLVAEFLIMMGGLFSDFLPPLCDPGLFVIVTQGGWIKKTRAKLAWVVCN